MRRILSVLFAVAWGACVAGGMAALASYDSAPGAAGRAPQGWPAASCLAPRPARATLVMFIHPRCPCTRASLAELARLMARCGARADAHVAFWVPERLRDAARAPDAAAWLDSATVRAARAIPGVRVHADPGGREAALFGGLTSGHVVAYDAHAKQLYAGGLTVARGHEGASLGREALELALLGRPGPRTDAPVFGCALARTP